MDGGERFSKKAIEVDVWCWVRGDRIDTIASSSYACLCKQNLIAGLSIGGSCFSHLTSKTDIPD